MAASFTDKVLIVSKRIEVAFSENGYLAEDQVFARDELILDYYKQTSCPQLVNLVTEVLYCHVSSSQQYNKNLST